MTDVDPLLLDFASRHPDAFASVLGRGDPDESTALLEGIPNQLKASIVSRLPAARIEQLTQAAESRIAAWLLDTPFDDAAGLLSRLPRERRLALIETLPDGERKQQLKRNQQYPAHCIGALIGDLPLRVGAVGNAADVLQELRHLDPDDPGPLVVVDADGSYVGILDRWRLLMGNPPRGRVADYVLDVQTLDPETPIASAVTHDAWHSRNWLPVVDYRRRVLGGVSRKQVFEATTGGPGKRRLTDDVLLVLLVDLFHVLGSAFGDARASRRSA